MNALLIFPVPPAQEPDNQHQRPEDSVDRREDPRLGPVEEDFVQPVLDEPLCVPGFPGTAPQFIFPEGQRAEPIEPGLQDNNTYRRQVRDSKVTIVYP